MSSFDRDLYDRAKAAFEERFFAAGLRVNTQPVLTPERRQVAISDYDPRLAQEVRKHLPGILPLANTPVDMVSGMSGLIYLGEIPDIPDYVVPFFAQGLFETHWRPVLKPEPLARLFTSINETGYPTGEARDKLFKQFNRYGSLTRCACILSTTEALKVFSENPQESLRLVRRHFELRDRKKDGAYIQRILQLGTW